MSHIEFLVYRNQVQRCSTILHSACCIKAHVWKLFHNQLQHRFFMFRQDNLHVFFSNCNKSLDLLEKATDQISQPSQHFIYNTRKEEIVWLGTGGLLVYNYVRRDQFFSSSRTNWIGTELYIKIQKRELLKR